MSDKDYTVPALQKGLQILTMFDGEQRRLSQAEIAKRFGVSSSSLYRIIQTLVSTGFLNKVGTNTYELGSKVLSSGFSYLASREIIELATPHINKLRDITSLSSHLAIREDTETLYVYRALALQRLSVNVPVGTRFPCHTTAVGRALLSSLSPATLQHIYQGKRLDDYPAMPPQSLPDLITMCEREREQGYHINASDYAIALAAPVYNYNSEVIAAINVSGPEAMMSKPELQKALIAQLRSTAADITTDISGLSRA
ncbi:MAG: IclR family transcriptional regulator [Pseudomonadales bacterium]